METRRVLIVEDNPDNLELVRFLVTRLGHTVLTARTGREGLAAARQQRPDLILLDLSLPELDGWAAAGELKADPQTAAIPLVALTAHTLPGDRQKAIKAGCDGYISKPIDVARFDALIAELIGGPGDPPAAE